MVYLYYFETIIIMNIEKKKTIAVMIQMYCKSRNIKQSPCAMIVRELLDYANKT